MDITGSSKRPTVLNRSQTEFFPNVENPRMWLKQDAYPVSYENMCLFRCDCIHTINSMENMDMKPYFIHAARLSCASLHIVRHRQMSDNLDWRDIAKLSGKSIRELKCSNSNWHICR